jgi:CspA family cold shock protein
VAKHKDRIAGTVRWFDGEEGWGVIDAPEVPGGCFVLFSNIVGVGYRSLEDG